MSGRVWCPWHGCYGCECGRRFFQRLGNWFVQYPDGYQEQLSPDDPTQPSLRVTEDELDRLTEANASLRRK